MTGEDKVVLVTGSNGGLGLGICQRLIDDFILTQPRTATLTLIPTTRDSYKGTQTNRLLEQQLAKHGPEAARRVHFHLDYLDLTSLVSIRDFAQRLLRSDIPRLDAIILNAGIGGWSSLNWPKAVWTVTTDLTTTLCWPQFKIATKGLVTKPQIQATKTNNETPLGAVFCSNVFGHYMLIHGLMPLLRAPEQAAKVIWVGSIETRGFQFSFDDFQGLSSETPYESTKRITELMAMTASLPSSSRSVQSFLSPTGGLDMPMPKVNNSTPRTLLYHPGTCNTSIIALPWILFQAFTLATYVGRWIGQPWCTASCYTAAFVATWLTFASHDEIDYREKEAGGGPIKWGTAVDRLGRTRERPTMVDGYGINGSGEPAIKSWWGGGFGLPPNAREWSKDDVEEFEVDGSKVWAEMERLRIEWEQRLDEDSGTRPLHKDEKI